MAKKVEGLKATAVDADKLIIVDSEDADNLKEILFGSLRMDHFTLISNVGGLRTYEVYNQASEVPANLLGTFQTQDGVDGTGASSGFPEWSIVGDYSFGDWVAFKGKLRESTIAGIDTNTGNTPDLNYHTASWTAVGQDQEFPVGGRWLGNLLLSGLTITGFNTEYNGLGAIAGTATNYLRFPKGVYSLTMEVYASNLASTEYASTTLNARLISGTITKKTYSQGYHFPTTFTTGTTSSNPKIIVTATGDWEFTVALSVGGGSGSITQHRSPIEVIKLETR